MLKMSGPRMWIYVRCKSSPAQICRPAVAGDGGGYQPTRVYRLTGCDGWPYPSQSSTVGGDVAKSSKC